MRAIQGALITASIPQIVLGVSGVWGVLARYCIYALDFSYYKHMQGANRIFICNAGSIGAVIMLMLHMLPVKITRFISPLVAAPLVGLAGLGLYNLGFPAVSLQLRPLLLAYSSLHMQHSIAASLDSMIAVTKLKHTRNSMICIPDDDTYILG
jgi:hypothetical protein